MKRKLLLIAIFSILLILINAGMMNAAKPILYPTLNLNGEPSRLIEIDPEEALFDSGKDGLFYPGMKPVVKELRVRNVASIPVKISGISAEFGRDTLLAEGLNVKLEEIVDSDVNPFFEVKKMSDLAPPGVVGVNGMPIASGSTRILRFAIWMPPEAGNEYQGLVLEANITIHAIETSLPPYMVETKTKESMTAGETYSFDFNLTVVRVDITVNNYASDVFITVRDYGDALPPDALPPDAISIGGKVYRYFNISTNLKQDDIREVTIAFLVARDWLTANGVNEEDVRLNRYNAITGSYESYPATLIAKSVDYLTYTAKLPGLSTFVITGTVPALAPIITPSLKGKYEVPAAIPAATPEITPPPTATPAPTATPEVTPAPIATAVEIPALPVPGMPLSGPAELPSGFSYGMHVFMGSSWVYSWGVVPVAAIGSETSLEIKHNSTIPVFVNLTQFNNSLIEFSISGNNTTITCLISVSPFAEYTVVDEDLTHNITHNFTIRANAYGTLNFNLTLASMHRVMLSQTPLSTATQITATAAVGTAVATAGAIAVSRAGSAVISTSIGRFDALRWLFEKGFKIKDVAYEVAEEAVLLVEERGALAAISFESIVKLSGIEEAYVGYAIVVLFAASAVEAWVANRFELLIIVVGAVLAITGYLGHEFMHKYMALHYRTRMEFKSSLLGGIITLFSSAIGASVAPVALGHLHDEPLDKKQRMLVSISGPMVNVVLAAVFTVLGFAFESWRYHLMTGITLNIAMAVASLLPVGFLEGKRIWEYSKVLCIILLFVTIAMQLFASTILG